MEATYAVVRERKAVAKEATQHRIGLFVCFFECWHKIHSAKGSGINRHMACMEVV